MESSGKQTFFNMSFGDLPHWWRSTAWVAKYNTELPEDARICDRHFEERFIDRTRKKPRLMVGTIPTLGLEMLEQVNEVGRQVDTDSTELFCRLCAKKMKRPMKFQLEQLDNLQTIIECCLGKFKDEEGLPRGVCYDCMDEVNHFSEFAKKCEQAQSQLVHLVRMKASRGSEKNSTTVVTPGANKENSLVNATRTERSVDNPPCIDEEHTQRIHVSSAEHRAQIKSNSFKETCPECDKVFSNAQIYQAHLKAHAIAKQSYVCHICEKHFYVKRELRIHLESVHGGKRFECHICGKVVNWQKALTSHMREHDTELRHNSCTICDKFFPSLAKLKVHQASHVIKRFKCTTCDASYRYVRRYWTLISVIFMFLLFL